MNLFTAQVYPGEALGFIVLGSTLHNILTALKAEPHRFPKLELIYSPTQPVVEPVILTLPFNGIRLRFDGPEQRLRLIEIIDFSRNKLTYKNIDVAKPASPGSPEHAGPKFRHVYDRLFGPTYAGEYVGPNSSGDESGVYVLSYPGVAFSFPISGPPDETKLLSVLSSATLPAVSMAIFSGESWAKAREDLYTRTPKNPRLLGAPTKGLELCPEDVGLVKILGGGRLELVRQWGNSSFMINLNITTPQELVAELGPPDAIYRKNDQRLSIHTGAGNRRRSSTAHHQRLQDDSTDTDQSSAHTITDDSDEEEYASENLSNGKLSGDCFYNYFYHGFDILISTPSEPSQLPPSLVKNSSIKIPPIDHSVHSVATKIILHSNVPGSYPFNRHRRCRWELSYLKPSHTKESNPSTTTSETSFSQISSRLSNAWQSIYSSPEQAQQHQRGMVLNRGWGDSPGSSCELLGGWEESVDANSSERKTKFDGRATGLGDEDNGLGNTTLFGFPGLIFEVLRNGAVSGLTVF